MAASKRNNGRISPKLQQNLGHCMRELLRTNDVVLLSFAQALLEQNGLHVVVLDTHMSVLDGSIGALPRRLMVVEAELARAREVLESADIAVF